MAPLRRLHQQPRNAFAIGILLIIASFGFKSDHFQTTPSAHADSQRIVSLYVDGQKRVITTNATTVADLLRTSGVTVASADLVEPAPKTAIPDGFFNVNVYRARPIVVHDGSKTFEFASAYQSPHLLAQQAGLKLYPEDAYTMQVVTDVADPTQIGVQVQVKRAVPLIVHVDGHDDAIRTQAHTVGTALADAGVKLGLKDTVSLPATAPIEPGLAVDITRVADVTTSVTDSLPFATKTIIDPTMLVGQTTVKTAGVNGSRTGIWLIHYQNGAETSRTMQSLVSQTAPVQEVLIQGSKVLFAGSVEYWRPQVEAAAAQWGLDPNKMMRIMACESGGNATSISHFIVNGEHPEGLFQFLPSTWTSAGGTTNNILDGSVQIQLAAKKMATQGFSAWQCQ